MDYKEAKKYLEGTIKFGSRLGLIRMDRLMELLGNPGGAIDFYHIAGTNGKGSVTVMIANCLAAGGRRVGVYTSPFIERFSERIRVIDGPEGLARLSKDETYGEIGDGAMALGMSRIKPCVDRMLQEGLEHPTEFELITALAFWHFERTGCDAVVLETGLGGRLDSTNWVRFPKKCILTPIGYDHMDRLGNTIAEIAAEKAGIIKPGADVILCDPAHYADPSDASVILSVVREKCEAVKAKSLTLTGLDRIRMKSYSLDGQTFYYRRREIPGNRMRKAPDSETLFRTSLLGIYQPMNCAAAIACCENEVPMRAIQTGIRLTRWPARMERVRKENPPAFLDGGHNAQGAEALRATLEKLQEDCRIVFLCGVMKDKEYQKMLTSLFSSDKYQVEAVFCTKPDNPRALSALFLAKTVAEILHNSTECRYNKSAMVFYDDNVSLMTTRALQSAAKTGAVFVAFGSLYMAGEIRGILRHDLV